MTRSSGKKEQSTKNGSDASSEVFKTPLKELTKTPKSSRKSETTARTRCDSEPSISNTIKSNDYICRVCKNTENLRLSLLDTSVETLLGKLNRANESFSESMGKVESLSLNLRHFLVFNSEKAQTQQTLLSSIEECIKDISHKAEAIEESLKKNEDHVASLNSTINEVKSFKPKDYPNFATPTNVNNDSSNSFFSVDHQNRRVIKSISPLSSNPTKHIANYEENFLSSDARLKVCQFLDGCTSFVNNRIMKSIHFGKTHNQLSRSNSNNEIPEPLCAIIDILHDRHSIQEEAKLNSVVINKFSGPHTKLPEHSSNDPAINPDSTIFTVSLGDSCPVIFRDKCTNTTINVDTTDNSMFSMSPQSQHYWTHTIDTPVISDSSVHYCITFRSINRSNKNATLIVGDSNTNHIYFAHEKNRSNLGRDIYRRRVQAFTIDEIEPIDCIGFQNVVIQVGLNNL